MKIFLYISIIVFVFAGCASKLTNDFVNQDIKSAITYKYDDGKLESFDNFEEELSSFLYTRAVIKRIKVVNRFFPTKVNLTLKVKNEIVIVQFIIPEMEYELIRPENLFIPNKTIYYISDVNNKAYKYIVLNKLIKYEE